MLVKRNMKGHYLVIFSDAEYEVIVRHSLDNYAPESIVVQGIIETGFKQFVKKHKYKVT